MSKHYCNIIAITCFRVLNSSPGCLDLGGLGCESPVGLHSMLEQRHSPHLKLV